MLKNRNKCAIAGFGSDYHKIREFLVNNKFRQYTYGSWDFMTTHTHMDLSGLDKIAVWEENGEIVGLVTYDCFDDESWSNFCVKDGYGYVKREMLEYAKGALMQSGDYYPMILDTDTEFHDIASDMGFFAWEDGKEHSCILPIRKGLLGYSLPDGFRVSSLSENYDIEKFHKLFMESFDELDCEPHKNISLKDYEREFKNHPYANLDIKIIVIAPNGDFAAYCGMWYDKNVDFAQVEPVGTSSKYRKLGLGRAAVLEGVKRCGELGATVAQVDTNLQFYHSIGFRPYITTTAWGLKGAENE
jgi:GNAT superfamily N-acetyltransferase